MKRSEQTKKEILSLSKGCLIAGICYVITLIPVAVLTGKGRLDPEGIAGIKQCLTAVSAVIGAAASAEKNGIWYLTGTGTGLVSYALWAILIPTAMQGGVAFSLPGCLSAAAVGAAGAWTRSKKRGRKNHRKKRYG